MPSAGRRILSRINAAAALILLVAGGMVTSTASGLAVPDWPLSYGRWLPAMTGGVFFEHGHRMIATLVGLLILLMALWTHFEEQRPAVRRLAWWTLLAVCLQGVLGGITVFYGLPVAVSAAHAVLGQTVFCLLVVMAELMRPTPPQNASSKPSRRLRRLGALAVAAVWAQLVLGAVLRHGGAGLRWHLVGAAIALWAAGRFASTAAFERREPFLHAPALALLGLLALQLTLGTATAVFRLTPAPRANAAMVAAATLHLVVGATLLGTATVLAFRCFRITED